MQCHSHLIRGRWHGMRWCLDHHHTDHHRWWTDDGIVYYRPRRLFLALFITAAPCCEKYEKYLERKRLSVEEKGCGRFADTYSCIKTAFNDTEILADILAIDNGVLLTSSCTCRLLLTSPEQKRLRFNQVDEPCNTILLNNRPNYRLQHGDSMA